MNTNQKMKRIQRPMAGVLLGITLAGMAPMREARADAKDIIAHMSLSLVESILGGGATAMLFPADKVDYDRIRKEMEAATKQAITDAQITLVMGRIDAAKDNAATDLNLEKPIQRLEDTRKTLVGDINEITHGQFRRPGLGNYVEGAQIELNILAAQRALDPTEKQIPAGMLLANGEPCTEKCYTKNLIIRLDRHIKYVAETRYGIISDNLAARLAEIDACADAGGFDVSWYGFVDNATKDYFKYADLGQCRAERAKYLVSVGEQEKAVQEGQLAWINEIMGKWNEALDRLKADQGGGDEIPFSRLPYDGFVGGAVKSMGALQGYPTCGNAMVARFDWYQAGRDEQFKPGLGDACISALRAWTYAAETVGCTEEDDGLIEMLFDQFNCDQVRLRK